MPRLSGKVYYECPASYDAGSDAWQPLLAPVVDGASPPGQWAVVEQDSDVSPTSFVVAVSDRRHEADPRGPAHQDIAAQVSGARYLGATFAEAQGAARTLLGAVRAGRMRDQDVGGE